MVDKNLALLVDELKKDGVEKGQQEADKVIANAKKEAEAIVAKAKQDAHETLSKAEKDAESIKRMSASGAKQAGVSLVASLKQTIDDLLTRAFGKMIKDGLEDAELVNKMLVSFSSSLTPGANAEITVSDALDLDKLTKSVFASVKADLAKGIEMKSAPNFPGIAVQMKGESVKYELTEKLLKEMICPFLSERAQTLLFPKE